MSSVSELPPLARAQAFAERLGIRVPILLAPMAGACPPPLSIAVAEAGGLGACGALLLQPREIASWSSDFRAGSTGQFQINLWIPDPPLERNAERERLQRDFLAQWGPPVPPEAAEAPLPDFAAQCEALLAAAPRAISSIMGLYPPAFVAEIKSRGILWFATVTTVAEARAAEAAGADVIVAQGSEAGGHRGSFDAARAHEQAVGLFSLLPQVVDAVRLPVIATGGIADARAIAAALVLGASAVQIGTGFLRTPEAQTPAPYRDRLAQTEPEDTILTRAFSGRLARSVANNYARAALHGPPPAPYPIQRNLTRPMRDAARAAQDPERMQLWAGQSAKLAQAIPAGELVQDLWRQAQEVLAKATRAHRQD